MPKASLRYKKTAHKVCKVEVLHRASSTSATAFFILHKAATLLYKYKYST